MKYIITSMTRAMVVALALLSSMIANAQTADQPKIGYVDVDYVFSQLPEAKQIESELKAMEKQLTNTINAKTTELRTKYDNYMKTRDGMLTAVAESTERELQQQMQNLEELKQNAQTSLENKNNQLLEPVFKKISDAIAAFGKQNGYSFILNGRVSGQDIVLFGGDKTDVSDLILKQLGVTPPTAQKTAGNQ